MTNINAELAQAEIDRLRGEVARLEASLRTVQNAATTLHRARDTELAHLRENAAFDQRLRQEHQSLMDRDALMTDALLAAEAEVARLIAERKMDREALEEINNTGAEQDGALGRILRMQRIALARLEDTDD